MKTSTCIRLDRTLKRRAVAIQPFCGKTITDLIQDGLRIVLERHEAAQADKLAREEAERNQERLPL